MSKNSFSASTALDCCLSEPRMFLSQTHFARKLESIKDIYSEAEQRVRVTQSAQSTTQRVTHKGVTTTVVVSGPGSTQASGSASPTKGKTSRGPAGECFCYV
jgi:hypothetical protein